MNRSRIVLGALVAVTVVGLLRTTTGAELDPVVVPPGGSNSAECCEACCPGGGGPDDGSRIYLDIRGIPGEAPDVAHLGQIEVLSYAHDFGAAPGAAASKRSGGKVEFGDLRIRKYIDKSSPVLMKRAAMGDPIAEATLWFHEPGTSPHDWMSIRLTNAVVTNYSVSGAEGEKPIEELSFSYDKYELQYQEQKLDGATTAHEFRWDLKAAKPY